MHGLPWDVHHIFFNSAGSTHPSHITVTLDDIALYPAVETFVDREGLRAVLSETGQRNQRWIPYPHADYLQAEAQLEQEIALLYRQLNTPQLNDMSFEQAVAYILAEQAAAWALAHDGYDLVSYVLRWDRNFDDDPAEYSRWSVEINGDFYLNNDFPQEVLSLKFRPLNKDLDVAWLDDETLQRLWENNQA